ncbi:MAG: hypothetical protein R8P61_12655 [Bacteroidia bacterium]|nr:hypothetical protein [Bacteroidia bacterium]
MIDTLKAPSTLVQKKENKTLWTKYLDYCLAQEPRRFMWTAVALMLPCILIPLSLYSAAGFSWFPYLVIGFGLLFFANLVSNLVEIDTRFTISLFFGSSFIFLATPLILLFL